MDWVLTEPPARERFRVALLLRDLVVQVHAAGAIFHDLKLENVGLRPDGGLQLVDLNAVSLGAWDGQGGTWYAPGEWVAAQSGVAYDHVRHGDCFRMAVALLGLMCGTSVPHLSCGPRGGYEIDYPSIGRHLPSGDLGDLLHHMFTVTTDWYSHPWWEHAEK